MRYTVFISPNHELKAIVNDAKWEIALMWSIVMARSTNSL
jgi:hypothetical protein